MEWVWHSPRDRQLTLAILGIMLTMSTIDMIADWINFAYMDTVPLMYGLVTGGPSVGALAALLAFNIIGTLLYAMECVNTVTILTNARHTRLPIQYEQAVVLILEEIPLVATNINIVACRLHHVTSMQLFASTCAIVNVAIRLYVYGWFSQCENRWPDKSTYENTVKVATYTSVSMLWLALVLSLGFLLKSPQTGYHHANKYNALQNPPPYLNDVSLFLLFDDRPKPGTAPQPEEVNLHLSIGRQKLDESSPWLVQDIAHIAHAGKQGAHYSYQCPAGMALKPPACSGASSLKFRFKYLADTDVGYYGMIKYNFAKIDRKTHHCEVVTDKLNVSWHLMYAHCNQAEDEGLRTPWMRVCNPPVPEYDKSMTVC